MKRSLILFILVLFGLLCGAGRLAAQDLVITNVRIIVGNGNVIEQGSIVVRGGKLTSVAAAAPNAPGVQTIDAHGMTAVPGFIDAHRHIMQGNADQWLKDQAVPRMQEFLDAGYTTLLSGGGPVPGILQLKQKVDSGEIKGPRIIASGQVALGDNMTPDMGIHFIGEEGLANPPTVHQMEVLRAIVDESKKIGGVYVMVHAVSIPSMMAAVDAGVPLLVHTPHFGWLSNEDAEKVQASGIKELSTIAFGAPVFGAACPACANTKFADDNVPRFRDGGKWPDTIIDGEGEGREAGYKAVNARTLWDAGVVYGYGTDTGFEPKAGLSHELRALNLMFSPKDVIKLMGPNTAAFVQMSDQIGTLEVGKLADIVIVDGDPLKGYWNLLNTRLVIKGGVVVSDQRNAPRPPVDF